MTSPSRLDLTERLLAILIVAATSQIANAYAWSLAGALDLSWIGSLIIGIAALAAFLKGFFSADPEERELFSSAWKWPVLWFLMAIMFWQVIAYPPTMNDSLSYRLPRIFLWLQDGSLSRTGSSDPRSQEMPWDWEILALPLVAINRVGLVGLLNLAAWITMFLLLYSWALEAGSGVKRARWISLALSSAPIFLLQATSSANDLFAAALLMVSVHFILSFARNPHCSRVFLSLLPFMMACGVKPQFLVLGLGWGLWWILGNGKPWKHTPIPALMAFVPVALLISPLPVFVMNFQATESFLGNGVENGDAGSPAWNALAATIQFLFSQLQLAVMPGAEKISLAVQSLGYVEALHSRIPKFIPGVTMIPIIDSASLGLVHFSLVCLGIVYAFGAAKSLHRLLLVSGILAFVVAGAVIVPETIGRSFIGFVTILLPLAAAGLSKLSSKWLMPLTSLAIASGAIAMILNPSSPAWPSDQLEAYAIHSGKPGIAEKLHRYNAYRERSDVGGGILDIVPEGEAVGLLLRGGTPQVGIWLPDWRRHRLFFVHGIEVDDFQSQTHRWLLIGDNAKEFFPKQSRAYASMAGWEVAARKSFRPTLSQAPENWILYRKTGELR